MKFTLSKYERIHSKKLIEELFVKGNSFFVFPFKVFWKEIDTETSRTNQLLISVPKKVIKNASNRNKVKRLVREAYRLNKLVLKSRGKPDGNKLAIGVVYHARTIMTFHEIERKIILILQRLNEQDEQAAR